MTAQHLDSLATATNLAYPVADVLLLALLGAVPAVLGARIDGSRGPVRRPHARSSSATSWCGGPGGRRATSPAGPLELTWMVTPC